MKRVEAGVFGMAEDLLFNIMQQHHDIENHVPPYWSDIREFLSTEYLLCVGMLNVSAN